MKCDWGHLVNCLALPRRATKPAVRFCVVLCLGWTSVVRAEPTITEIAVARRYFEQATIAENEHLWQDAVTDLKRALASKETAGPRYHLGFAEENLGLLVDAMLESQRAKGLVRSGVTSEDVERFIAPKLEEMQKRVPTLLVRSPPDVSNAELQI